MAAKAATYVIAALYLLMGVLLFFYVPRFTELYESLYINWNTDQSPLVRAFHFPGYIWILSFGLLAGLVCSFGFTCHSKVLKQINIYSTIILIVLAIHAVDWLAGFAFCHEWGYTRFLPTWRLFTLLYNLKKSLLTVI